MHRLKILIAAACLPLAGCFGLQTPQIQEFWGTPDDANQKVQALVGQVRCELGRAIYKYRHEPNSNIPIKRLNFLDQWAVQIILILSVEEKSAINPGASVISPLPTLTTTFGVAQTVTSTQSFTGNFGGGYSNDATTIDRTTLFYKIKDLDDVGFISRTCRPPALNATLFSYSDLGIDFWLQRSLNVEFFENADINAGHIDNVLSHDVKFEIISSGNATPTWKLVRFTGNTANPFFSLSRDRIQELIITMGKTDKVGGGLSAAATISSLAQQVGSATALLNRAP